MSKYQEKPQNIDDISTLATKATLGEIDTEQAHAAIQVLSGKQGIFGASMTCEDADGQYLVPGKRYKDKRGNYVMPIKEEFGAGNILDTYYRLYYYDNNLEEKMVCIEASGSPFTGRSYKTGWTKAFETPTKDNQTNHQP